MSTEAELIFEMGRIAELKNQLEKKMKQADKTEERIKKILEEKRP